MNDPVALHGQLTAWLAHTGFATLRLVPLTLALPFLGGQSIPAQARTPVLFALAVGASPELLTLPPDVTSITSAATLGASVLREALVGTLLALVLATPLFALEQAGRILDAARGANVAEVIAPDSGARTSPLSELLRWTFGVVFLASGGLRAIVRVIATSYAHIPVETTSGTLPDPEHWTAWTDTAARWTAESLTATFVLASSGLIALLVCELALATAARLSPPIAQSQIAVPIRALAPLGVLAVGTSVWTGAALELSRSALAAASGLFP